ncbi:unnamed protein product, partial [Prorocentrum cordatum]
AATRAATCPAAAMTTRRTRSRAQTSPPRAPRTSHTRAGWQAAPGTTWRQKSQPATTLVATYPAVSTETRRTTRPLWSATCWRRSSGVLSVLPCRITPRTRLLRPWRQATSRTSSQLRATL